MTLRRRHSGTTLVEMLAAVGILVMITMILAQVFAQASKAASKGKGMGEMYQVARAIESLMERDLSGATPDFFACAENGGRIDQVWDLPPGPYSSGLSGAASFTDERMRRMLMGGSDYLALTSANATGGDQGVAKVFYVLRATGELIRVSYRDTSLTLMDYLISAIEQGIDINNDAALGAWEERRVVAENIQRLKLRFLDRSTGPISKNGPAYAHGVWVEDWDWNKGYLPAAVEVEIHLVDHLWAISDDDQVTNRNFDPTATDDNLRACEAFDADDGESFRSVINLPLGMN